MSRSDGVDELSPEQWRLGGHIVETQDHTVVADGPEDGNGVTVISAAVFCG